MRKGKENRLIAQWIMYIDMTYLFSLVPKVGLSDTHILSLFFDNLEKEHKNIRTYVQDALSSMIEIYVDIGEDSPIYKEVQGILLKAVQRVSVFWDFFSCCC